MKVSIFYFSGTGNTLYVAKKFAQYLSKHFETKLINIEDDVDSSEFYDAEILFLAYPIYMSDMPLNMKAFVRNLPEQNKSIGTICTQAVFSGDGAYVAHKILEEKGYSHTWSKQLNAFTNIGLFGMKPPKRYEDNLYTLAKIDDQLKQLADDVYRRKTMIQDDKFTDFLLGMTQRPLYNVSIKSFQKKLRVDKNICNECMLCVNLCPTSSISGDCEIEFINRDKCLACMRCVNYCPANAISTSRKKRKFQFKGPTKDIYTDIMRRND